MKKLTVLCMLALFIVSFADTESFAAPTPKEKGNKRCNDNIDNDLDGKIDGDDPDCVGDDVPPPPPPSPAFIYTVEVDGSFSFGPEPATLNQHENGLLVTAAVPFNRPGGGDAACSAAATRAACLAWDAVFDQCATPYEPTMVPVIQSFVVLAGNLAVELPGDRRVAMNVIPLPDPDPNPPDEEFVEVWVHLIGPEDTDLPLLPRDNSGQLTTGTTRIPMERLWFGGRTVKGIKPRNNCHPKGTGVPPIVPLEVGAMGDLVIRATTP